MYIIPLVAFIVALVHIVADRRARNAGRITEIFLQYMLVLVIGIGGLFAFYGHAFLSEKIAQSIGWQPGSPFQFEVAAANLAFGVLGILCVWFRKGFWLATGIGVSVFYFGAAFVHIREMIERSNYAVNNAGSMLWVNDIGIPLFLLTLLGAYFFMNRRSIL